MTVKINIIEVIKFHEELKDFLGLSADLSKFDPEFPLRTDPALVNMWRMRLREIIDEK